ncbi:2-C-methyl-D-erythritol 2,4-cyclodiphosphate synthase [Conexibacter sp. CPCC 206217]|uniref:2-C-methyl-D-erythritol 2,4-cyclodiphosphate synthase n=1 Tax=Conexibacter sp. CPCC 206217 TaxID=3064574 RepID=UPI002726881D|nr:2-C-methyl-D-erythritol 2,4-cyclodiphosphate synthase [Conexibacter sp. CPCC 206217]MDO8209346.1 2-C-methyl-D-erythritol 2,4-cyclodiphosphate synthase [Conexibacter sp. CPCC 206217]
MVATGVGWDVHRLVPDRPLIVGGVTIPNELGLEGHSDADVLTHAVIDALLGAAGLGDIGEHFPDTDEYWSGANSLDLLRSTRELVVVGGVEIAHVDATVMLERPKLLPHKEAMRANLAGALELPVARVNVKATRGEGMGFVGRVEGAAALAIATLQRPED